MKTKEITLFNIKDGPLDEGLKKSWELVKSTIINDVNIIVDNDDFLRERIDELRFNWEYDIKIEDPFYACIHLQGKKISKDLVINIPALEKAANHQQELLFQLYKLPGEEKAAEKLPIVQRKLKKWTDKLGDYFFVLYPAFHTQLAAAGVQQGLMRNYPKYKEEILDSYLQILEDGLPRNGAKYDLGDITVEILERDLPVRKSLFRLGSLKLLLNYGKDYLSHYTAGTPVYTMSAVFSSVDDRIGKEMKNRINDVYGLADKKVVERLSEDAKTDQKTFDEFYYPALDEETYPVRVNEFLSSCVEMQQLMKQRNAPNSLIKPSLADLRYITQASDFLTNTGNQNYIR